MFCIKYGSIHALKALCRFLIFFLVCLLLISKKHWQQNVLFHMNRPRCILYQGKYLLFQFYSILKILRICSINLPLSLQRVGTVLLFHTFLLAVTSESFLCVFSLIQYFHSFYGLPLLL